MATRVEDNRERSRYEAFVGDRLAGYTNYRRRPDLIAIDHTDVDERFEGEGIGSSLAVRALDDARKEGLAVLPFCPFVNEYIQRHPAYADLVPESMRERFGL
jgi:predicted GNAT family acetyltransferase